MDDLVYVIGAVGFFAAAAGYVWFCDRLIGRDESIPTEPDAAEAS